MISDGQIQADFQSQIMMPIANQITDGQVQVQVIAPVTETVDGQPQAPTVAIASATTPAPTSAAPATTAAPATSAEPVTSAAPATSATASSAPRSKMVACDKEGQLAITLDNGILKDAQGRTGYIADNFQFQFDGPPQAGAIFTAGFSACGNGTLAFGGSNIFYQCLSGSFYNLYDRMWAAQCSPVTIDTIELQQC